MARLHRERLLASASDIASDACAAGDVHLVARRLPRGTAAGDLRTLAGAVRDELAGKPAVVFLAAESAEKAALPFVVALSKQAVERGFRAGDLVKVVGEALHARGGGKADMAQGSGARPEGFDDAERALRLQLAES